MNKSDQKLIDKMFEYYVDYMFHLVMVHGFGFCAKCGELRKRCECKSFVEPDLNCKCFDK